jgi:hypothetical protein
MCEDNRSLVKLNAPKAETLVDAFSAQVEMTEKRDEGNAIK